MLLTHLQINNFRCFDKATFDLSSRIILIEGKNGSGKSSLLEALHYLCYLRSFRTYTPRELIKFGQENFFIKVQFNSETFPSISHELQVGFAQKKRVVKLNQKNIESFKELMDHYRVVTITEDDLSIIKGGPLERRQFMDQAVLLEDPGYAVEVRSFKRILENRNSLLQSSYCTKEACFLWTEQLWEKSRILQKKRVDLLTNLETKINGMLHNAFNENLEVSLAYAAKNDDILLSWEAFLAEYERGRLFEEEKRYGRSLFGAHLDDISIVFQERKSKKYASRGQQKLIVLLLKIAQITALDAQRGPAIMLLDDFMTDFDEKRAEKLVRLLSSLPNQLIFTAPSGGFFLDHLMGLSELKRVKLPI